MVYRKQETDNGASGIYSDSFRDTLVFLSLGSSSLEELFQQQPRPTCALIPSRLPQPISMLRRGVMAKMGLKTSFSSLLY